MGVYIRGLEKSESCNDCLFRRWYIEYSDKTFDVYCGIAGKVECQKIGALPAGCPVIAGLPETHGRLIDADALIKSLMVDPLECPGCPEPEYLEEFIELLEGAHTIIPAEGEE